MRRAEDRGLLTDDRRDARHPGDVRRDLAALIFHVGGPGEALVRAHLRDGMGEALDLDKRVAQVEERLVYVARHGRVQPSHFEGRTARYLQRWVEHVSDLIRAENKPRGAAT